MSVPLHTPTIPVGDKASLSPSIAPEMAIRDPHVRHLLENVLQVDEESPLVQFLYSNGYLGDIESLFYLHPASIREHTYLPVDPQGHLGSQAVPLMPAHVTKLQSFTAWLQKIADQDPPDAVDWTECTAESFKLFRKRNMQLLETFLPATSSPSSGVLGRLSPQRSSLTIGSHQSSLSLADSFRRGI